MLYFREVVIGTELVDQLNYCNLLAIEYYYRKINIPKRFYFMIWYVCNNLDSQINSHYKEKRF